MRTPSCLQRNAAAAGFFLALLTMALAAVSQTPYQTPSQVLVDIVDAETTPRVSLSPDHEWLLLMQVPNLPSLAELAEPELRLAGLRISPQNSGPSRTRPYNGLKLFRLGDSATRTITGLPQSPRIDNVRWSPDGAHIAFTVTSSDRIEAWVAEVESGAARRLTQRPLNLTARTPPSWLPDSKGLIATLVPSGRGAAPVEPTVPIGPVIQESSGRKAPARTYQDLLQDRHDEELFDHYFSSQIVRIGLDGEVQSIGPVGVVWDANPSPSGEMLLVETVHAPYSYRVPMSRFPRRIEVWDLAGKRLHQLADLPLQEEVPMVFGSVPTGARSAQWRADQPATLVWVEALDGGDASAEADLRDRVFTLDAPFTKEPRELATLGLRYAGIHWGNDDLALVSESWWQTRQTRTWRLRPGRVTPGTAELDLVWDRSYEDRYSDPGSPETRLNAAGRRVLYIATGDATGDAAGDGAGESDLYLIGRGASPEGDRPFLDTLDLSSKNGSRLFRSEAPYYETPVQLLERNPDGTRSETPKWLLTLRESPEEAPNYFLRHLDTGELRQLTRFPHPTPQLAGFQKELIKYQRDDGVDLTATLYLPKGYESSQGPLPMLMWAYPREFKSAAAAGQVRSSPYRFNRINYWSSLIWLARGYAVLDDPAMPIVGEGDEEPNNTYVEQLVSSARAAVDEVVRRGVTEAGRIAIGGHSYGAFMTANLLAHSDLYAAGIARSGAYNRTLTPFGFQAEQRSLWQAPEIYFAMSPFMHAEKVNEPILLIHGQLDNNSGTFPMQSERYYSALKGHGATARLVMLPYESHGYRSRESLLHMLWEQEQWLEKYVRPAESEPDDAPTSVDLP